MSKKTLNPIFHWTTFLLPIAHNSRVISVCSPPPSRFIMHPVTNPAFEGCFERGFVLLAHGDRDRHGMTVFVERDPNLPGFRGLYVACVHSFFSITHNRVNYPCTLVSWFSTVGESPCLDTGMWMVEPDFDQTGNHTMSIIHLDSILCGAHLMGVSGSQFIPPHLKFTHMLDTFHAFYVNKYIDHHTQNCILIHIFKY